MADLRPDAATALARGICIPAHPLALTDSGELDRETQSALSCYYLDAGGQGLAVGVHTTQFEIREHGLLSDVLELAATTCEQRGSGPILIAGVCGTTEQALAEARTARDLGYDLALVSMRGLEWPEAELIEHVRAIGTVLPVMGFYLQAAVGGRRLGSSFWRDLADLDCVKAIKIAPFNRYATWDVVRGVAESSRAGEVALYTGNDDNIVVDLLTTYEVRGRNGIVELPIVGSLLGQNAVGFKRALALFDEAQQARSRATTPGALLTTAARLTDFNAAVFDVENDFYGCIVGVHEVLRRDGLLKNTRLLDPDVTITATHRRALERALNVYEDLRDEDFVRAHTSSWRESARRVVEKLGDAHAPV